MANMTQQQLEDNGHCAVRLSDYTPEQAETDCGELLTCLAEWYHEGLRIALSKAGEEDPGKVIQANPRLLFTTEAQLCNLLDCSWRKANLPEVHGKAVRAAFDGNASAQFQPWRGWRFSGFGIVNHLRGCAFVLRVARLASPAASEAVGLNLTADGMPHPLFKPPSATQGKLKVHVDGGVSLRGLMQRTGSCESSVAWAQAYGVQSLAHVRGASCNSTGGHTVALANLTVLRYHVLLCMLCPDHPHPEAPSIEFDKPNEGPLFGHFFDLQEAQKKSSPSSSRPSAGIRLIRALNKTLLRLESGNCSAHADKSSEGDDDLSWLKMMRDSHSVIFKQMQRCESSPGQGPVKVSKICPLEPGPYLAIWLRGFPHGALATGPEARLSVNVNLQPQPNSGKRKRGSKRTRDLIDGDFEAVKADSAPYEDGIVHKKTAIEVDNFRFFKQVYATKKQLDEFEAACDATDAACQLAVPV